MTNLPPGQPNEQVFELPSKPKTSGLAIASLVCGIGGLCTLGLGSLVGIILGALALSKIGKSAGAIGGKGLAVAGLVVSAISILMIPVIAMLIAILMPALFGAMDMAKGVASVSNLSLLTKGTQEYAAAHRQQFPPVENWDHTLLESGLISRDVLTDPSDPPGTRSYAMNSALAGATTAVKPGTVLFFECVPGSPPSGGKELLPPKPRHARGYVIGFCDGHVDSVPPEKVSQLIWNPQAASPGP
jgi:prepilin-type processing-associated H-X9-DG protein